MRRFLVGIKRVREWEDVIMVDAEHEEDAMDTAEEMAEDQLDLDRPPVSDEIQAITCEETRWEAD